MIEYTIIIEHYRTKESSFQAFEFCAYQSKGSKVNKINISTSKNQPV